MSVLPCQLVLKYNSFYELREFDVQPVQRRVQLFVLQVEQHYYILGKDHSEAAYAVVFGLIMNFNVVTQAIEVHIFFNRLKLVICYFLEAELKRNVFIKDVVPQLPLESW